MQRGANPIRLYGRETCFYKRIAEGCTLNERLELTAIVLERTAEIIEFQAEIKKRKARELQRGLYAYGLPIAAFCAVSPFLLF